jgi:hypothetical protein
MPTQKLPSKTYHISDVRGARLKKIQCYTASITNSDTLHTSFHHINKSKIYIKIKGSYLYVLVGRQLKLHPHGELTKNKQIVVKEVKLNTYWQHSWKSYRFYSELYLWELWVIQDRYARTRPGTIKPSLYVAFLFDHRTHGPNPAASMNKAKEMKLNSKKINGGRKNFKLVRSDI